MHPHIGNSTFIRTFVTQAPDPPLSVSSKEYKPDSVTLFEGRPTVIISETCKYVTEKFCPLGSVHLTKIGEVEEHPKLAIRFTPHPSCTASTETSQSHPSS